ncbi:MAG: hypothetical protein WC642_11175 [Nocardioides sp.]|jgi:hypothetical protein
MALVIEGLEAMKATLQKCTERGMKAACAAVYLEANNIIADTLTATPKDTGALRSSGYVTLPEENSPVVEMGFGGPAADYAVTVHEDLSPKNWTTDGTGPKFLENAIDKHRGGMEQNLGALYQAAFDQNAGASQTTTPTDPWQGSGVATGGSKSRGRGRRK